MGNRQRKLSPLQRPNLDQATIGKPVHFASPLRRSLRHLPSFAYQLISPAHTGSTWAGFHALWIPSRGFFQSMRADAPSPPVDGPSDPHEIDYSEHKKNPDVAASVGVDPSIDAGNPTPAGAMKATHEPGAVDRSAADTERVAKNPE